MNLKTVFKLNEKAALLIGFGVPSLLVIYYLFRRKSNELEDDDENINSRTIKVRPIVLEVKIPNECVKHVIGPQGSVIKESKTNTRINFKDKSPNATTTTSKDDRESSLTERIIVVRGAPLNVQRAELEIKRLVLDMPINLTQEYLIPEYACGRIIGRGGSSIRDIIQVSGCKVTIDKHQKPLTRENRNRADDSLIYSGSSGSVKLATFVGTIEQIEIAKELILSKIKEEDDMKKRKTSYRHLKQETTIDKVNRRKLPFPSASSIDAISDNSGYQHCSFQPPSGEMSRDATFMTGSSSSAWTSSLSLQHHQQQESSTESQLSLPPQQMPKMTLVDLKSYLDEDNRVDVLVSAFSYSLVFWVQVCDNLDTLRQFSKKMTDFYRSNSSFSQFDVVRKDDLREGDIVALKSNGSWFRVEIKSTNVTLDSVSQPNLVDVYYIDEGISDYVQLGNTMAECRHVKRLPAEFYELPMQAIECTLCDIDPCPAAAAAAAAVGDGEVAIPTEWSQQAAEYFEKFIFEPDSSRQIQYVSSSSSTRDLVRLFDKTSGTSLSELMVQKGYAVWKNSNSNSNPNSTPQCVSNTDQLSQQPSEESWDENENDKNN